MLKRLLLTLFLLLFAVAAAAQGFKVSDILIEGNDRIVEDPEWEAAQLHRQGRETEHDPVNDLRVGLDLANCHLGHLVEWRHEREGCHSGRHGIDG